MDIRVVRTSPDYGSAHMCVVEVSRMHGLVLVLPEAQGLPLTGCPAFSPGSPLSQLASWFRFTGQFHLSGFALSLSLIF